MSVPSAAPSPPGSAPKIVANTAGITTAGLNCPAPQGDMIPAVTSDPIAYSTAHVAEAATVTDARRPASPKEIHA